MTGGALQRNRGVTIAVRTGEDDDRGLQRQIFRAAGLDACAVIVWLGK